MKVLSDEGDGSAAIWFDSAGTNLFARAWGHRVPLVMLHGNGLESHQEFAAFARAIADNACVLACDIRGFARSVSPDPMHHTWPQYAEDVVALLDCLSLPRAVVAGASFGSAIAAVTALRHPTRVAALVLALPAFAGAKVGVLPSQEPVWRSGWELVHSIEREGIEHVLRNAAGDDPRTLAAVEQGLAIQEQAGIVSALRLCLTTQPFAELQELEAVDVPALVIPGADDAHDPAVARLYAQHLPRARLLNPPTTADPFMHVIDDVRDLVKQLEAELADSRLAVSVRRAE